MSRKDRGQHPIRGKKPKAKQTRMGSTKKRLLIGLGVVIAVIIIVVIATMPEKPKTYSAPPPMTIDTSKQYTATIETEKGDLVLELFASDVPITVNNFIFLARDGFYDGLTFHRVEPDFVFRVGAQLATGLVGPVTNSGMKSPSIPMLPVRYQWPIKAPIPIPTALSFSLRIPLGTTLMGATRYSVS